MPKPSRKWFLVLAIAVMIPVAVALLLSPPKAPIYHEKTVSEWVTLRDPQVGQEKQREEAASAIVQIGSNAVPELERILARRRHRLLETLKGYAVRFGLATPPQIHPLELQSRACEAASNLAERANVDISILVPHLRYHFTQGTYADSTGARALAGAGPTGIAALTDLLFAGNRNVRDLAGWALSLYPVTRRKPEVFTALIRAANAETNQQIRANFLLYLTGSRAPADKIVPLGLRSLRNGNAYERRMAAKLLQGYASDPNVQKALEEAQTRSNESESKQP